MLSRYPFRAAKACATNCLAHAAPRLYTRLTGETGRGRGAESPREVADYFRRCFDEYFAELRPGKCSIHGWLEDKVVVEYGPGDTPAVALLLLAYGARQVICVDRFPLMERSAKASPVLGHILGDLAGAERLRARDCLSDPADPGRGLRAERMQYLVDPQGLCRREGIADLVLSRAVMEHVGDLQDSYRDMFRVLKPGGEILHLVDLASHAMHIEHPLDFLCWSERAWNAMYSGKGAPNRYRLGAHLAMIDKAGFQGIGYRVTQRIAPEEVARIHSRLALPYRELSSANLCCLGFWVWAGKPDPAGLRAASLPTESQNA